MMDRKGNAFATIAFCSHLCSNENSSPLEPKEWNQLLSILEESQLQACELLDKPIKYLKGKLNCDDDMLQRLQSLVDRTAALAFELEKLHRAGIFVVTRFETQYPSALKRVLGKNAPPLFYYAGDLTLTDNELIGIVGSRDISLSDLDFTKSIASKASANGYGIVSGGAKGVDSAATSEATDNGGFCVEFLSDSLMKKLKNTKTVNAVRNGKLLLMSAVKPDMGFTPGFAMMRNKYIYASSKCTVVVKSDIDKGGTWAGATENLKKNYTPLFCKDEKSYPGNVALILRGAVPIDETWDLSIKRTSAQNIQLSLFDDA